MSKNCNVISKMFPFDSCRLVEFYKKQSVCTDFGRKELVTGLTQNIIQATWKHQR